MRSGEQEDKQCLNGNVVHKVIADHPIYRDKDHALPTIMLTLQQHQPSLRLQNMDLTLVKAELKAWERAFKSTNGRDPSKADIKDVPEIGQSSSTYNRRVY